MGGARRLIKTLVYCPAALAKRGVRRHKQAAIHSRAVAYQGMHGRRFTMSSGLAKRLLSSQDFVGSRRGSSQSASAEWAAAG